MAASFSRLRLLLCAHPFLFILHHAWGSRSWAVCQPALYFQLRGIKPQELGISLTTLVNCELGCGRGTGTWKGSSCVLQTRLVCQFHKTFLVREGAVDGSCCLPPPEYRVPGDCAAMASTPRRGSLSEGLRGERWKRGGKLLMPGASVAPSSDLGRDLWKHQAPMSVNALEKTASISSLCLLLFNYDFFNFQKRCKLYVAV